MCTSNREGITSHAEMRSARPERAWRIDDWIMTATIWCWHRGSVCSFRLPSQSGPTSLSSWFVQHIHQIVTVINLVSIVLFDLVEMMLLSMLFFSHYIVALDELIRLVRLASCDSVLLARVCGFGLHNLHGLRSSPYQDLIKTKSCWVKQ